MPLFFSVSGIFLAIHAPKMPMESFKSFVNQMRGHFPYFFFYAILEWIMIILLFIDGLIAFVANEFAKFFGLKIPCLLCTRIDHVLVHRNSSFYYNDSICEYHKKDISSLAYCHMHKKLSDIHTMCQRCLVSFATEKDSDCDKYKSIVGILHKDIDRFVEDERKSLVKALKKEDAELNDEKSGIPWCSCCGEPVKLRSSTKLLRNLSMKSPAPSPRMSRLASRNEEGRAIETPRSRFTELKFVAENEAVVSHDDNASNVYTQAGGENIKITTTPLLQDSEEINEEANRTPRFLRGNKYFALTQFDSALDSSPRWINTGLKTKARVEKGDVVVEPNDVTPLNEVEGDVLNRLKNQVRLDHKSLMAMYTELDKERSAAAVAANNAMAMITRIQAEKAAVQMEALQYQRMMEEQAEYDEEALQEMRDMLVKKDEEIDALESELEIYREKYGPVAKVGSEICEVDADEDFPGVKSQSLSSSSVKSDCDGCLNVADEKERESDFEGERSYLVGLLTDLEEKMNTDKGSSFSELGTIKNEDEGRGDLLLSNDIDA